MKSKASSFTSVIDKIRAGIGYFGKRLNPVLIYILKALVFFLAFRMVAGLSFCPASGLFANPLVHLALAALCALLPLRFGTFAVLAFVCYLMIKTSLFGGIMMSIFVMLVFLITVCFTPEYAFLLLLIPLFCERKLFLLIPLLAGIYGGPLTLVVMLTGCFMWGLYRLAPELMALESSVLGSGSIGDILGTLPEMIVNAVTQVIDGLLENYELVVLGFVFVVVVFLVWLLGKLRVKYMKYIAIAAATVVGMIGLFVCRSRFGLDAGEGQIILLSLLAGVIAAVLELFSVPLDYTGVRNISFQDDDYLYQVRVTPIRQSFKDALASIDKKSSEKKEEGAEASGTEEKEAKGAEKGGLMEKVKGVFAGLGKKKDASDKKADKKAEKADKKNRKTEKKEEAPAEQKEEIKDIFDEL